MDRRSGRNGHRYERCTLTVVTNLTGGYADDGKAVRLVAGVQLHGSSGARSSRLLTRGRRERISFQDYPLCSRRDGPVVISLSSSSFAGCILFCGVTRRRFACSRLAKIQSRLHLCCFNFRNAGR
jgi:hypothetical protein